MSRRDELRERWDGVVLWEDTERPLTVAPGRCYMLVRAGDFEVFDFFFSFDDARDVAAFVRYSLVPSVLSSSGYVCHEGDIHDTAREFFSLIPTPDSRRMARFDELLVACEQGLCEDAGGDADVMERIVRLFNEIFLFQMADDPLVWCHSIKACGDLAKVLASTDLYKADDEHAELADLVSEGGLDETDSDHLALAARFLERYPPSP